MGQNLKTYVPKWYTKIMTNFKAFLEAWYLVLGMNGEPNFKLN